MIYVGYATPLVYANTFLCFRVNPRRPEGSPVSMFPLLKQSLSRKRWNYIVALSVCWKSQEGNKDGMIDIWKLRTELRMVGPGNLLKMASKHKEHNCVLNPNGSCQFYLKHKGFGFCVSELSGQGCQAEKAQRGGEGSRTVTSLKKEYSQFIFR